MNVVHLMISGGIGGIEVLTKEISKISVHRNIFYFLFDGGVIADEIAESNPVHIANGSHIHFIGEAIKFTKFCKENHADVIIAHNAAPIIRFIGAYAKTHIKNVKFLLYWHGCAIDFSYRKKIKNIVQTNIEKYAFHSCDTAIAISMAVQKSVIDTYDFQKNKIAVIYNGIDTKKFTVNENKTKNTFNIIFVGRVFYSKGVHLLVKAISYLPKDYNIHLNIVGKYEEKYGSLLNDITDKDKTNDKISLCGPQTNVDEWLAGSNLFVHPAIWQEGFGITLAEAMACGVPCIAFDKGAMRELIEDGKNGYIVENQTPEDLAKAIEKVYNLWQNNSEAYNAMCSYAHESVQKFSIENTVKQLESLYE